MLNCTDKAATFYLKAIGLHIIVGKPVAIEETKNQVEGFILKVILIIEY
ncbi:hypothetical protein [Vibrio sp. F74]